MKKLYEKYNALTPSVSSFDRNSADEAINALKEQKEFCERRGFYIAVTAQTFFTHSGEADVNRIWGDHLTPYHNHDYFELNCCVSGQLVQYINDKPLIMNEGDLLFMPPQIYHSSFPLGDGYSINILLKESLVKRMEKKLSGALGQNYLSYLTHQNIFVLFKNAKNPKVGEIIRDILAADTPERPQQLTVLMRTNSAEQLLLSLAESERRDYRFTIETPDTTAAEKAEMIVDYINENYATVNLNELARQFGYSTQQIRRIIKKHTGYSYAQVLQMKRISVSMNLLAKTDLPIKQICERVGLESPEYFCRRFKIERGFSPSEFRKQSKSRKWEI